MNLSHAYSLLLAETLSASHNHVELRQTSARMDPQDSANIRKVLGMGIVGYLLGELHSVLSQKAI